MRQLTITKQITQRTDESINRYFQDINKYPRITPEEEVELAVRIKNGDGKALKRLVLANLRFVVSVAKQYQNMGLSFPDLINEGNIGLVIAAERFDETRGFKFISYAVWWIRQSMIQAIANDTRVVRLPLNRIASINKITNAILYLEQEFEREPTDSEIAEHLDVTGDEVKTANKIKKRQISFDMPFLQNDDREFSLYDVVQTESYPSPDDSSIKDSLIININRALEKLTNREAAVLTMSFGLFGTPIYTLSDIAMKYNMSSERVRQIRARGLDKLRNLLKGKHAIFE